MMRVIPINYEQELELFEGYLLVASLRFELTPEGWRDSDNSNEIIGTPATFHVRRPLMLKKDEDLNGYLTFPEGIDPDFVHFEAGLQFKVLGKFGDVSLATLEAFARHIIEELEKREPSREEFVYVGGDYFPGTV